MTLIWQMKLKPQKLWVKQQITLPPTQDHYDLVFEGVVGPSYSRVSFAIDDLKVENDCTCELLNQLEAFTRPTTTKPAPQVALNCDFEVDLCMWQSTNWARYSALNVRYNTAPLSDVTTQSSRGHYAMFNTSKTSLTARSSLYSPSFDFNQDSCLEFWYQTSGSPAPFLTIFLYTGTSMFNERLWSRQGERTSGWSHAYVHIGVHRNKKLQFVAQTYLTGNSYVAIDDVRLLLDKCPSSLYCDFEGTACNYQNDANTVMKWKRTSGSGGKGPKTDHTYAAENGNYMAILNDQRFYESKYIYAKSASS